MIQENVVHNKHQEAMMKYFLISMIAILVLPATANDTDKEGDWVNNYAKACKAFYNKNHKLPISELDLKEVTKNQLSYTDGEKQNTNRFVFCSSGYPMPSVSDNCKILCFSLYASKTDKGVEGRHIITTNFQTFFINEAHFIELISGNDPNLINELTPYHNGTDKTTKDSNPLEVEVK
jgi:hypothetical protein